LEPEQTLLVSAESRELDLLVWADALQREQRAKVALGVILRNQGCNPEQIEAVLNMLESQPEYLSWFSSPPRARLFLDFC